MCFKRVNLLTTTWLKSLILFLTLSFVSGCTNKPWSVIDGSMSKPNDPKNYNVYISGIGDRLYSDNLSKKNLVPGFNRIRLTTSKADRKGYHTYSSFPLETKPCVRYYVSAQHESSLAYDNKRWRVVVLGEEPIKSCEKLLNNIY